MIDSYEVGMNITGIAPTESDVNVVSGNSVYNAYYGINLWSYQYTGHTTGFGLSDLAVTGNTIRLTQTAWTTDAGSGASVIGNPEGISVNPDSNLPLKSLLIGHNIIEFDLESSSIAPHNEASTMGIGYWDALGTNSATNIKIDADQIINCPGAARIRWGSKRRQYRDF